MTRFLFAFERCFNSTRRCSIKLRLCKLLKRSISRLPSVFILRSEPFNSSSKQNSGSASL